MVLKVKLAYLIFVLWNINSQLHFQELNHNNEKNSGTYTKQQLEYFLEKAEYYYDYKRNADSIIYFAKHLEKLSGIRNSKVFLGKSYWQVARGHLLKNTLDSSKIYIDKALAHSTKTKDTDLESATKLLLARYYEKKNNLLKATELGIEVIKTAENNKDYGLLTQAYCKLANTYSLHDDNKKYKTYLDKAYKLITEKKIEIPISVQSSIYTYLVDYFEQKRFKNPNNETYVDSILFYTNKGITYTKSINQSSSLVYLLGIKGKMYFLKDELKKAKSIYNYALKYRANINKFHLEGLYNKLAYVHLKENDIKNAMLYKDSILQDITLEPNQYRKAEKYNVAYYICKTANKYDLALHYHEKMSEHINKAKDEKQIKALNELEIKYNTEKKDAEIVKQKLQNETLKNRARTNYFLLAISALILISILSLLYLKKRNKTLETELDLVTTKAQLHRSQINPHFISNSINAIYPFLYDKSDPNKAVAYLSDLSQMIRGILDSTFETTWSIKEELEFTRRYCKIQELKMNIPFRLTINCKNHLETKIIPSLLLQPFVENAFIHGFSDNQDSAEINISIEQNDTYLLINILDNGTNEYSANKNHKSRSTEITKQRIYSTYKNNIVHVDFINFGKIEGDGYLVTIKLPKTH